MVLYAVSFAGWGLVFYATCLISHFDLFDLFGLRQVWLYFKGHHVRIHLDQRPRGS